MPIDQLISQVNGLWPEAKISLSQMGLREGEATFILVSPLSKHFISCGTEKEIRLFLEGMTFASRMPNDVIG
jgi:uncharacterized protein YehS (DUF1456 family)